jgi:hypothetical protein
MKMNPVMARTRTDRLRIDSAGGETGSKIDVLWARSITVVAPFIPRRLRERRRFYPCGMPTSNRRVRDMIG